MNPVTQKIIEFLNHAELPFGGEEDVLLLSDPIALRERVASLLEESPEVFGHDETAALQAHLAEADWDFIAGELRARVETTSSFFEADAQASGAST